MVSSNMTRNNFSLSGPGYPTPVKQKIKAKKYRSLAEIMEQTKFNVIKNDNDSGLVCEKCGSGEKPDELLLCDKCDKGFHMDCVRPVVIRVPFGSWFCSNCSEKPLVKSFSQTKIIDFFKIQKTQGLYLLCNNASSQDCKKRKRRTSVVHKKRPRRLLPYVPTDDLDRRLEQMRTLATALTALNIEFSNELNYLPGMAPRSANRAMYEVGGMQVLSKEDFETVEHCRAMAKRGEYPPLLIAYDEFEGYTIQADGLIKQMRFIAEYAGDVDYIKNREHDDSDSLMTLILSTDPSKSLVVSADKRANISRFVSGINNHTRKSKKRQNLKCVRYDVNGECRVLLVASRDIAEGERLYYDYNGYVHEYPTHHFV